MSRPEPMPELGDCFQVAARLVTGGDGDDVLVHGIVEAPDGSVRPHWHAWVERTRTFEHPDLPRPVTTVLVIDKANGNDAEMPVELYYKLGNVERERTHRYSSREATAAMQQHGHYGPWVDDGGIP